MKSWTRLLILLGMLMNVDLVDAKKFVCKNKFKDNMLWEYCTKFGSAPNSSTFVEFKSRIKNFNVIKPVKNNQGDDFDAATVELAVYKD